MISSLHIKNIAVVKELNIDFTEGFSVLSGETGAGKSVIIDSIGMLLGTRQIRDKLRNGEKEAVISGVFDNLSQTAIKGISALGFDATEGIMLQRTFNSDGKSTIKLNGQTITLGVCKEVGKLLLTIHGQNDNQKLMQKSEHLGILDCYARAELEREAYKLSYEAYREIEKKLDKLKNQSAEKIRLLDIYKYQAKEIDDVKLKAGEEEKLLAEEKRLANAEKIEKHSNFVFHLLKGSEKSAFVLLDKASDSLLKLADAVEESSALRERLEKAKYEIEDIAYSARDFAFDGEGNTEARLDKIEARLDAIQKLKRKYGSTVEEILEFRKKLADELDEMENSDDLIEKLEKELKNAHKTMSEKAEILSEKRRKYAEKLSNEIRTELEFLEMPKVRFFVQISERKEPTDTGFDDVEFLVSANAGQEPMPMIKIASGGELSRIMLAVKSILLDNDGATSVIFDEIDTGISGKTSRKVGIKLKEISKSIQLICITHAAQIASLADNNYLISKSDIDGKTQTSIKLIEGEERIAEVARILGGLNVTQNQLQTARELVEEGKKL